MEGTSPILSTNYYYYSTNGDKITTSGTSRKSRNISNDQRLHELVKKMYMRVSVCNYIEQIILGKKQKRKLINIKMKNFSLLQL